MSQRLREYPAIVREILSYSLANANPELEEAIRGIAGYKSKRVSGRDGHILAQERLKGRRTAGKPYVELHWVGSERIMNGVRLQLSPVTSRRNCLEKGVRARTTPRFRAVPCVRQSPPPADR
jgi:hypothetical protein